MRGSGSDMSERSFTGFRPWCSTLGGARAAVASGMHYPAAVFVLMGGLLVRVGLTGHFISEP